MGRAGDTLKVLMPLTDGFGGHGGIALYNRDVIRALDACDAVGSVVALPRIGGVGDEPLPAKLDWREDAAGGMLNYLRVSATSAIRGKFDLIWCAHTNLLGISRALKLATGAKLILATYGVEAWREFPRTADRWGLAGVDAAMAISGYTADRFAEWSPLDRDAIEILPNAVDLAQYGAGPKDAELEQRYGLAGRKVVMLLGRMHETERRKGFDQLIEALPGIRAVRPDAALLFVGDGGDRARLEEKVRAMGLAEHVVFAGRIGEAEKAAHYRLADAYVMPGWQEGFGFVHLEAMACGIPSVASKADGARDAVMNGEIGLLVDPDDADDIVAKTLVALDRPRGIPKQLSHFAVPEFNRRLCDFVRRVAA